MTLLKRLSILCSVNENQQTSGRQEEDEIKGVEVGGHLPGCPRLLHYPTVVWDVVASFFSV